jgi:hypothetical protein
LTCSICLTAASSMAAGQSAPHQAPSADMGEKKPDKMFPDGVAHDLGILWRGKLAKHSIRIVNTSAAPLRIISVRWPP